MNDPRTIPCTVSWCASDRHPDRDRISHRALVAAFAGGLVTITIGWLERLDGRPSLSPIVQVRRGDASTVNDLVDLAPGEARLWTEILGVLDVAETLQFAAALLAGAVAIEADGGEEL